MQRVLRASPPAHGKAVLNLSASAISDFSLGQRAVTGAMHRIFKYRLYPNRKQRMMLDTHWMLSSSPPGPPSSSAQGRTPRNDTLAERDPLTRGFQRWRESAASGEGASWRREIFYAGDANSVL